MDIGKENKIEYEHEYRFAEYEYELRTRKTYFGGVSGFALFYCSITSKTVWVTLERSSAASTYFEDIAVDLIIEFITLF